MVILSITFIYPLFSYIISISEVISVYILISNYQQTALGIKNREKNIYQDTLLHPLIVNTLKLLITLACQMSMTKKLLSKNKKKRVCRWSTCHETIFFKKYLDINRLLIKTKKNVFVVCRRSSYYETFFSYLAITTFFSIQLFRS